MRKSEQCSICGCKRDSLFYTRIRDTEDGNYQPCENYRIVDVLVCNQCIREAVVKQFHDLIFEEEV